MVKSMALAYYWLTNSAILKISSKWWNATTTDNLLMGSVMAMGYRSTHRIIVIVGIFIGMWRMDRVYCKLIKMATEAIRLVSQGSGNKGKLLPKIVVFRKVQKEVTLLNNTDFINIHYYFIHNSIKYWLHYSFFICICVCICIFICVICVHFLLVLFGLFTLLPLLLFLLLMLLLLLFDLLLLLILLICIIQLQLLLQIIAIMTKLIDQFLNSFLMDYKYCNIYYLRIIFQVWSIANFAIFNFT